MNVAVGATPALLAPEQIPAALAEIERGFLSASPNAVINMSEVGHGEMHGSVGATPVFIELRSKFMASSDVRHLDPIEGRLRWCDGSGAIRDYAIRCDVQTWRGYRFRIAITCALRAAPRRTGIGWPGSAAVAV